MNEKDLIEKAQSLLAEDEFAALEKLIGSNRTKPTTKHSLQEHYLKVVYTCKTCAAVDELYFFMKQHPTLNSLVSEPISTIDDTSKLSITDIHKISLRICKHCREYLSTLTKEEVIDKLINQLTLI
jgi:hypothetical protein